MVGSHPNTLAIHLRDDGVMDGCAQYRFRIPFEELRRRVKGCAFDWAPISKVRDWSEGGNRYEVDRLLDGRLVPKRRLLPTDYDIFLLPRFRPELYGEGEWEAIPQWVKDKLTEMGVVLTGRSHLIDLMRVMRGSVKMVVEYDDDYFTGSRDLNYELYDLLYDFMKEVDAFTVSTPYLRGLIQKYAPGKPVYVLPNAINWDEWQGHERIPEIGDDRIVLGLTGSMTHQHDWRVLEDVLPRILREHGEVIYLAGAYLPEYLEPLNDQFPDQFMYHPPVDYMQYPQVIRQADIVLCPVDPEDPFNLGKSAIKAIEGLAASRPLDNGRMGGAVPITSDLYYYRRVTGGNKRGLTIEHTPEAWYKAITSLITNKNMRQSMAQKGRAWVLQNRAIENQWHLWWNAYREIYRRKT